MGLKYRKQIKIAPGVKLNINKKSASISVGGKGLSKTISTTGKTTTTVGIPGSGLSYSTTDSTKKPSESNPSDIQANPSEAYSTCSTICFVLSVPLLIIGLLYALLDRIGFFFAFIGLILLVFGFVTKKQANKTKTDSI